MADFTRRAFVAGTAAAGVSPMIGVARAQQGYPAGLTIKFIVGFPAGGAQDIVGRIIADRLGALWKATTVVENIAGAGGNIGMDRVAKGSTDGTQICIIPPQIAINQFLYRSSRSIPRRTSFRSRRSRACRTCCASARICRSIR